MKQIPGLYRGLLIGVFMVTVLMSFGQQKVLDAPLLWTSMENINLYSNIVVADTFEIRLTNESLTLRNKEIERTFPIRDIKTDWQDITKPGKLVFKVLVNNIIGEGVLKREAGILSLDVDLSVKTNGMKRRYILQNTR